MSVLATYCIEVWFFWIFLTYHAVLWWQVRCKKMQLGFFAKSQVVDRIIRVDTGALSIISPCIGVKIPQQIDIQVKEGLSMKMDFKTPNDIIDNASSASIIQLPIFSFLLFCYQNVRSLLESRSSQPQGWFINWHLATWSINWSTFDWTIDWLVGWNHPKWINCDRRWLYFPTLDPTTVTCSLSVLNIE